MIGCSFVVDREYFSEIGLLDPGMEVYGGENIELGMRVSTTTHSFCLSNSFPIFKWRHLFLRSYNMKVLHHNHTKKVVRNAIRKVGVVYESILLKLVGLGSDCWVERKG